MSWMCRGCYALGSACGDCDSCREERQKLADEGLIPFPRHQWALAYFAKERQELNKKDEAEHAAYIKARRESYLNALLTIDPQKRFTENSLELTALESIWSSTFWKNKYLLSQFQQHGMAYYFDPGVSDEGYSYATTPGKYVSNSGQLASVSDRVIIRNGDHE